MSTALFNPYISYPKDLKKINKLRCQFETGLIDNEQLDLYEKSLVRDWMRCKALGVDPTMRQGVILPENEYKTAVADNKFIIEKSVPILIRVSDFLSGVPGILILTNSNGVVLYIIGDPSVRLRAADDSNLLEGSCWIESVSGTNGIGTAMARKEAVHVYSNEHFCEGLHKWACAATPILHPFTNDLLGVIDFTTIDKDYRDDAVGLTYSLAGHINAELKLHFELERMHLIHCYTDYSSRYPNDGIVVLDSMGRVVRSSHGIDQDECNRYVSGSGDNEHPKKLQQVYLPGTEKEIGSLLVVNRKSPSAVIPLSAQEESSTTISTYGEFVTVDKNLKLIMERISTVSSSDINVLLTGETGTGKELIANYIQMQSKRRAAPFITVNCGAISKELFESKLFGYEKGAFTGADPRGRKGVFECANGGTLFLDEIGEMPLDIQTALLRVLETGRFNRVGSEKELITNCRIIAATNRVLTNEIDRGTFRADLYYRIGVAKFNIPALRERPCDIPVLIQHTMLSLCRKHDIPPATITSEAMNALINYNWPGNGREVRNVIESAMICRGDCINLQDLPININFPKETPQARSTQTYDGCFRSSNNNDEADNYSINYNVMQREANLIKSTLTKYKDVNLACKALRVSRSTFYRKCRTYQVTPIDYM